MATTHAAIAMAAVAPLVLLAPEVAVPAALAAGGGGLFPDLDVVYGHRKLLHYPVGYWLPTALAAGGVLLVPSTLTVVVAVFFGAAALHSVTDIFGGGLGLRPWENDDQRGVYDHRRKRWIRPRRYVRYDGAPEDFLVGAVFAVPTLLLFEHPVRTLAAVGVAASGVYALVRKRMPAITPEMFR